MVSWFARVKVQQLSVPLFSCQTIQVLHPYLLTYPEEMIFQILRTNYNLCKCFYSVFTVK